MMPQFSFASCDQDYQPNNAFWLAQCASLVYDNDIPKIQSELARWGLTEFKFIEGHGTQSFVAGNDDIVIVCFRGTETSDIRDVLADAKATQIDGPWGRVHSGFANALAQIWPDVRRTLTKFRNADQGLWLTGHSLGAALATLAAAHLVKEGTSIDGVYTYGQPRVGDAEFSRQYDELLRSRHFRFVNNNDVVTRVPPASVNVKGIKLEYRDVGQMVYAKCDGCLSCSIGGWALRFDRLLGRLQAALAKKYTDGLGDHSMVEYVNRLQKNIDLNPFH